MSYSVKFLFADATVIEEQFPSGISVQDAKLKLISSWPAGPISSTQATNLLDTNYTKGDMRAMHAHVSLVLQVL